MWERFSQNKRKPGKRGCSPRNRWLCRNTTNIHDKFLDGVLGLKAPKILQER